MDVASEHKENMQQKQLQEETKAAKQTCFINELVSQMKLIRVEHAVNKEFAVAVWWRSH